MMTVAARRMASGLCVSALTLAGVPALDTGAQASSSHHSRTARHKAKKKKQKTTRVLVKCATVTVTCHATPGERGPAGPAGQNGANGANGLNGAALVARARMTAPLTTTTGATSTVPVPPDMALVGNIWVQQPGEIDYITAAANVTTPATCVSSGNAGLAGTFYLDGVSIGAAPGPNNDLTMVAGFQPSATFGLNGIFSAVGRNNPLNGSGYSVLLVLTPPAAAATHTLSAGVDDLCTASGNPHYVVNSFEIDVAAAR